MFKKIFKRINDFIQWTKKWHFFHVFMLPAIPMLLLFFLIIFIDRHSINADTFDTCFMLSLLCYIQSFFIALIIQIFFFIFKAILRQNCKITNKFLLNNKIYNSIYTIMFIYTIVYLSLLVCTLFLGFLDFWQ